MKIQLKNLNQIKQKIFQISLNKKYKYANDKIKGKTLKKIQGSDYMIKKIAWDAFKNTGDINAYLEMKQIETIEKELKDKNEYKINEDIYGEDIERQKRGKWQIQKLMEQCYLKVMLETLIKCLQY